jgi:thymidylate kinase
VDILTNNFEKFKQVIETVSAKAGYAVRIFRRYDGLVKFHLISDIPELGEVLEIDVGWDIRWKGISLIPPGLLDHHRLWRKVFYTLQPGPEAAISLIKDLIYHGAVKEKYKPGIMEMIRMDRDGFLKTLTPTFGLPLVKELAELSIQGNWSRIDSLTSQFRRQAVFRALRHRPLAQLGRWAGFLWWNLLKFFRPSGLFVVLMGPDGSGKSTVAEGLQAALKPLFPSSRYFHGHFGILPRLRDLGRLLGLKPPQDDAGDRSVPEYSPENGSARFGRLRSLAYLIYYAVDYLLGYPLILYGKGRGELIIFDRYYYDYVTIGRMSLPGWLLELVRRLIPNPDVVVYLKNDPEVLLSRKLELSREQLTRQSFACSQLISRLRQGQVVETTGSATETIAEVRQIIIRAMVKKGGRSVA